MKWGWDTTYPVIKISFGGVARDLEGMYRIVGGIMKSNQKHLRIKCEQPCAASLPPSCTTNYTRNQISIFEGYYASIAYVYLASFGLDLRVEDPTSTGRIDMTINAGAAIYILEFKVDGSGDAREQIRNKKYHLKFMDQGKDIYLIGIDFDSNMRNISSFEWEKI